jgi:FkbM family methyltransferase
MATAEANPQRSALARVRIETSRLIARCYSRILRSPHFHPGRVDREIEQIIRERLPVTLSGVAQKFRRSTAILYSPSQLHQDLFVLEHLDFKTGGYFVEVGVGNGRALSNTYLLEKQFGWIGLLCEPNPVFTNTIRAQRSVPLDCRAAFATSGEHMAFLCTDEEPELSTIESFRTSDTHARRGSTVTVETVTLNDLLSEHGAPDTIDYLSLDTEGSEIDVLSGLDLRRWDISVMTIEHNDVEGRLAALDRLLGPHGYRRVAWMAGQDAWYVKGDGSSQFTV